MQVQKTGKEENNLVWRRESCFASKNYIFVSLIVKKMLNSYLPSIPPKCDQYFSLAGAEAIAAAADAKNPVKIAPFSSRQKRVEREVKKNRLFGSMKGDADAKNY